MGYCLTSTTLNEILNALKQTHQIYAPVRLRGKGRFSDSDLISYSEVDQIEDVVFNERALFSAKEVLYPINQTLFYFTEKQCREPDADPRGLLIFLRSCDIHAVKRLDQALLENGPDPDYYYQRVRSKVKWVLMDCPAEFAGCFCVSMGTNATGDYAFSVRPAAGGQGEYICNVQEDLNGLFAKLASPDLARRSAKQAGLGEPNEPDKPAGSAGSLEPGPLFVAENSLQFRLPQNPEAFATHPLWEEYSARCVACGRCNMVCPTCSCFTMQDIFYEDNPKAGERRRVWAGCQIDGFSDMAGGNSCRQDKGERMRYKVLHKIQHFKQRFGVNLCVGCGRCDSACPEYISFAKCVSKLSQLEAESHVK